MTIKHSKLTGIRRWPVVPALLGRPAYYHDLLRPFAPHLVIVPHTSFLGLAIMIFGSDGAWFNHKLMNFTTE